jgi:hypothetical protein
MAPEEAKPDKNGNGEEAAAKPAKKKLSRKEIIAATEEVMIRHNVRRPHDVLTIVSKQLELTPKSTRSIRGIVNKHYDVVVRKLVGAFVRTLIKEGTEDFKTINVLVRKEKYSIEDTLIIEMIRDEKKAIREAASQRVKDRLQTSKEQKKDDVDPAKRAAAVELYKGKLRASVSETINKQREKDIEAIHRQFTLEYLRETVTNEQRVMIHRGIFRGREVFMKTIFKDEDSEEVDNVQILFRRVSGAKKLTINFDVRKLQDKWTGENGIDNCKKNLSTLNKVLDFKDFSRVLSFLLHVLDNAEDVPRTAETILDNMFFPHIRQIEDEFVNEFVTEIVEKKYYQMSLQS